jgi:hypothetical protein
VPFIPVPGVCQVVIGGTVSTHPFNQVWHFQNGTTGSAWSVGQLDTLCNTIMSGIQSHWVNYIGSNVTYDSASAVDLTNSQPAEGNSTTAAFAGTEVGGDVTPSLCTMVNFHIPRRYKGGHPRTYFPPGTAGSLTANEDQWIPNYVNQTSAAMASIINGVVAAIPGATHCSVAYTYNMVDDPAMHKYHRIRAGLEGVYVVSSYQTSPWVRTQRRRLTSIA